MDPLVSHRLNIADVYSSGAGRDRFLPKLHQKPGTGPDIRKTFVQYCPLTRYGFHTIARNICAVSGAENVKEAVDTFRTALFLIQL